MLLIFIIFIIEVKSLYQLYQLAPIHHTREHSVVVLATPERNLIQTSVFSGRVDAEPDTSYGEILRVPTASDSGPTLPDLTLTNSLTVLGDTLFGKTSIAGGLSIDGSLSLGAQGIQSLGDTLYIQKNTLAYVDVMNGALRINTDGLVTIAGNLNVQGILGASTIAPIADTLTIDLDQTGSNSASFGGLLVKGANGAFTLLDASGSAFFSGNVQASGTGTFTRIASPLVETSKIRFTQSDMNNSVGTGTIPFGFKTMKMLTNAITKDSHVFITPISVSSIPISVTKVTPPTNTIGGSFTVETPVPVPQNLDFSWFIIN